MPTHTTFGRLLLEEAVPADLRRHVGILDSKGIRALADKLAAKGGDTYRDTMKRLSDVAVEAGYLSGGYSFGPKHLEPGPQTAAMRSKFRQEVRNILNDKTRDPRDRDAALVQLSLNYMDPLSKVVFDESRAAGNPLAKQVESGAKGKADNLRSLISGDVLYLDSADRPVPYPIMSSFAEGLRPHEYLAAAFGARKAITLTKLGTADGGWLSKRLGNAAHRLLVTAPDAEDPHAGVRGLPVDIHDPENENTFLASPIGDYPRNTLLTKHILGDLKAKGHKKILIRSPLVGGPADGGVYGYDVGVRERGGVSPVGDYVGRAAADAVSEPIVQTIIGSKHGGGVAGQSKSQTGFPVIERQFAAPKHFPGGASHAQTDGTVTSIHDAPQGGKYITVAGHDHYVPNESNPTVAVGDKVEAGDVMSEGVPNPAQLVEHKHIGEARRQFLDNFSQIAVANGFKPLRRNLELLVRGYMDHVRMEQEHDDLSPGDITSYTVLEHNWTPRERHKIESPKYAIGKYLERPTLHYTIGTRITPRVADTLAEHDVKEVTTHHVPPPFSPVLIRTDDTLRHDPDWMTQELGSGLEKSLLTSAARGAESDPAGSTSFVPALAEGINFGKPGTKTRGWNPADIHLPGG